MKPRALKNWLLASAWAAVILLASSEWFSVNHTSRLIEPILHWLFPAWSTSQILRAHFIIRKIAHVTEYGVLGILVFRALFSGQGSEVAPSAWRYVPLRAILICAFVAAADEFHQSFVPSRTGSPKDVLLDVIGAVLFIRLALSWEKRTGAQPRAAVPQP